MSSSFSFQMLFFPAFCSDFSPIYHTPLPPKIFFFSPPPYSLPDFRVYYPWNYYLCFPTLLFLFLISFCLFFSKYECCLPLSTWICYMVCLRNVLYSLKCIGFQHMKKYGTLFLFIKAFIMLRYEYILQNRIHYNLSISWKDLESSLGKEIIFGK